VLKSRLPSIELNTVCVGQVHRSPGQIRRGLAQWTQFDSDPVTENNVDEEGKSDEHPM
jgi:hypothetical protein